MIRTLRVLSMLLVIGLLVAIPVSAQQPLITSGWDLVVYQPENDALYWINAQGVQRQMNRPHLPDEAAFLDLRFAPSGTTLLIAARLNTGVEALGIYDLNASMFTAVQMAAPGSSISLGQDTLFTADQHEEARWAHGGDWLLFVSQDGLGSRTWNIARSNGTPAGEVIALNPNFVRAYGTPDGYLLITNTDGLFFSSNFAPEMMVSLAQLTPNSRIAYLTPSGAAGGIAPLPNTSGSIIDTTPSNMPPVTPATNTPSVVVASCTAALSPRVFVGGMGRVTLDTPTLNVRQQPGGAIVTTFGAGTTFYVTSGFQCVQDLMWWQIERFGIVGWVAESLNGLYLIEPYAGPMSTDPTDTPVPPAPPVVPVCGSALPSRLSVGSSATVVQDNLRPYNGPGGEALAQRFFQSGTVVAVNAGPECTGGEWWWLVTGSARVGRIGQNYVEVQGWVAETVSGAYNLSP
ncbi:MAG: hypothetical protein U0670_14485 [Anaerolineae bacterium]